MEIPKQYDPKQAEQNHYERWEKQGCFAPEINRDENAPAFSIVIPPPNVTGSLHMGHALQHTMMDVLTRYKRMCGYPHALAAGHGPRRHLDAVDGDARTEKRRTHSPRPGPRKIYRARLEVEEESPAGKSPSRCAAKACRSIGRAKSLRWTKTCRAPCAKFSCVFMKRA